MNSSGLSRFNSSDLLYLKETAFIESLNAKKSRSAKSMPVKNGNSGNNTANTSFNGQTDMMTQLDAKLTTAESAIRGMGSMSNKLDEMGQLIHQYQNSQDDSTKKELLRQFNEQKKAFTQLKQEMQSLESSATGDYMGRKIHQAISTSVDAADSFFNAADLEKNPANSMLLQLSKAKQRILAQNVQVQTISTKLAQSMVNASKIQRTYQIFTATGNTNTMDVAAQLYGISTQKSSSVGLLELADRYTGKVLDRTI